MAVTTGARPNPYQRSDMRQSTCLISSCERPEWSRGWCRRHYDKWRNHGDPSWEPPTIHERFWSRAERGPDCWEWQGYRRPDRYGLVGGRTTPKILAHRLAWQLTYGPIPTGLFVCHHCDNPPCVRPDHLFLGTQTDNMRDAAKKGRIYSGIGARRAMAKVTPQQVREIRSLTGLTLKQIGMRYGIKASQVSKIRLGQCWADVA